MGILRLLRFTGFTLLEYLRGGRVLIEAAAAAAFFYFFLFQRGEDVLEPQKFFSLTSLFSIALTIYTMSSMMGLGDRAQGYLLLSRRLGRIGYLLGFYLAAVIVVSGAYGLISLLTATLNRVDGLQVGDWILGSLPLLLNVALMAALLLSLPADQRPTAIVAANNFIGISVIEVLRELRLRVPEDIAVVCFDDIELASALDPFLTVVAQPARTFGIIAAQFLFERLDHVAEPQPRRVVLAPELIVRRSCGSKN